VIVVVKQGAEENPENFIRAQETFQEKMPVFINAMLKVSSYDIHRTLERVCHKLLKDHSVSEAVRRKRAEGLLILGTHFRVIGEANMSKAELDAVRHMVSAMVV